MGHFQPTFVGAEASTSTQKSKCGSTSRPRLVKVRRSSNSSKGKIPASSGGLFSAAGANSGSSVDNPGYNPFGSNNGASLASQSGYSFTHDSNQSSTTAGTFSSVLGEKFGNQGIKQVQSDSNQSSTPRGLFSSVLGENFINQGFKQGQNDCLKSSLWKDSAKQKDDLRDRLNSWNPFVGASENTSYKSSTGGADYSGSDSEYYRKREAGGFSFEANTGEKFPPKENADYSGSDSRYLKKPEVVSFSFWANTEEKLPAKENVQNVAAGNSVNGHPGAAIKDNIKSMVNEVNHVGNVHTSLAGNNGQQATKMDSTSGDVKSNLPKCPVQGAFVFSAASKPKPNVGSRHAQDLSSFNRIGRCEATTDLFCGVKNDCGSTSENPFNLKNIGYSYDNPFAAQRPISGSKFIGSAAKSSFELTGDRPIPPTFTFNAGGKFEPESEVHARQSPLFEPFAFSAGSSSTSAAPGGYVKETTSKAASNVSSISAEMGAIPAPLETPRFEDSSSIKDGSWPSMESLSSSLNQMFEFSANKSASNSHSTRKKRDKSQLPTFMQRRTRKHSVCKSKRYMACSTVDHTGYSTNHGDGGSPMDFSPCNETASQTTSPFGNHNMPDLGQSSVPCGTPVQFGDWAKYNLHESLVMEARVEELRSAAVNLHIGADQEQNVENNMNVESSNRGEQQSCQRRSMDGESCFRGRYNRGKRTSVEEKGFTTSSESEGLNSRMEKVRIDDDENTPPKAEGSNQSKQFTFAAFSSTSSSASVLRRHARRSHRPKVGENIQVSNCDIKVELSPFATQPSTLQSDGMQGHATDPKGDLSQDAKQPIELEKKSAGISDGVSDRPMGPFPSWLKQKEESGAAVSSSAVKSAAAEQACEKWRLRGNQAYANGDFPKAEDYYSRGASSVSPNETSQSCIRASMLCYSNRAATRMAVGRMREALADCMRAMAIDPNFLRVRIRAASCHLALGESEAAVIFFKECMRSAKELENLDLKIAAEASDGLRKAQQGWEYTDRAAELLDTKNPGDATNALRIVIEALSISPHSERLLELKALGLLSLRKYEDVIQVCEQSLESAEQNCCFSSNESQVENEDASGSMARFSVKLWRWRMIAKAHFHLGRLEEALDLLLKYEEINSAAEKSGKQSMESLASFTTTIRDLLRHKAAGNKAFQAAKHAEAVEHYTAALACNGESRPFTAVCFCNRAAASQALGHVADAIADCSRAIALDPNYPKAISRRATLHEMVRNYGQASNDLRRLITLLERQQQQGRANQMRRSGSSSTNTQDLRQARERLAKVDDELKRGNPLDHYLILGVEALSTAAEIKKAYRKAALRHHPDKAGQFLVRSDSGDDGLWKEVGEEVRRDAERLFKMIGEAYAILSDPSKRVRYDTEEELRKLRTRGSTSGSQTASEAYRYQYEKGNRRQRDQWDSWNGYANQYQRWQSGPDAAQPDTYARRGSNNSRSSDGSRWNEWDDI